MDIIQKITQELEVKRWQVEAAVQVGDCAAWLHACNLLALVADGDLLVKVGKVVVEIDGEFAVVALLNVDDIAVYVGNDGLALLYLIGGRREPVEMLACDKFLSPHNLFGIGCATVLRHPAECCSIDKIHPVPFVLDDVVAVGIFAGMCRTERIHNLCLFLGKDVAVIVVVILAHPYHKRSVDEVYL